MSNSDKDKVRALMPGFLEIVLRDGWSAVVATSDIESIRQRTKGAGCVVHVRNGRSILLRCPIGDVTDVMKGVTSETP